MCKMVKKYKNIWSIQINTLPLQRVNNKDKPKTLKRVGQIKTM